MIDGLNSYPKSFLKNDSEFVRERASKQKKAPAEAGALMYSRRKLEDAKGKASRVDPGREAGRRKAQVLIFEVDRT